MEASIRVSRQTIEALAEVVTGGSATASPDAPSYGPYRTGPELVRFFNQFGVHDKYPEDVGSRVPYARRRLSSFNGTPAIRVAAAFLFIGPDRDSADAEALASDIEEWTQQKARETSGGWAYGWLA